MVAKRKTLSLNKHRKNKIKTRKQPRTRKLVSVKSSGELIQKPVCDKLEEHWQVVCETAVGLSHRKMTPPMPCQDACTTQNTPRLALFLADGAGSAKCSDIGSQTLVQSLKRLVLATEGLLCRYLDDKHSTNENIARSLAEMFYRYSVTLMQDLAQNHRRSDRDFRSTLLMTIVGRESLFWLKVGDGAMLYQSREGTRHLIGEMEKGEFANQTVFIDSQLPWESVQFGMKPCSDMTGLALMSDGAAERLVAHDSSQTAGVFDTWFKALQAKQLGAESLYQFFNEAQVWEGSTHDDKSLALAARGVSST